MQLPVKLLINRTNILYSAAISMLMVICTWYNDYINNMLSLVNKTWTLGIYYGQIGDSEAILNDFKNDNAPVL